jgi:hypothetical protein
LIQFDKDFCLVLHHFDGFEYDHHNIFDKAHHNNEDMYQVHSMDTIDDMFDIKVC